MLPGAVNGALRVPVDDSFPSPYPGPTAVAESGGLACEMLGGGPGVSILALADAQQEFDESRSAIEAVPSGGGARVYADSPVGDGGFVTCRDTGSGGLCTWSVISKGVWLVVDLYPLALDELEFPPDLPSGWAQPAYPAPDGALDALVGDLAALASSAPPLTPTSTPATSCLEIATPARIEIALGFDSTTVSVSEQLPAEVAAAVTSTAGYALPYYAASRSGWSPCFARSSTSEGQIVVVTRPLDETSSDAPAGECLGPGDGYEELCRVAVVVGDELRVAQFTGPGGVSSIGSLTSLVS
jgi:hypothetical protein